MSDVYSIKVEEASPSIEIASHSLEGSVLQRRILGRYLKRAMDIALSLSALLALSPVFLFVAIIIKMSDGGPVFYAHERSGLGGTRFRCLKFRSMKTDASAQLAQLLATDSAARSEWEATRKLKNDPRVTVLGDILRKSSLDELPQLINVLRGEMSLVGPRPITAEEHSRYGDHLATYFSVRPGLTGHWQTNGRNDVSYQNRVQLDVQYVRNWSLMLDALIIARTIPILFSQRGSY